MESKHTPGPWEFFPAKDRDGDETIGIRGNSEFIATMDLVSICRPFDRSAFRLPENGEANARLIAAAPDLLSALESMVATWDGPRDRAALAFATNVVAARAAIAKARGEQ